MENANGTILSIKITTEALIKRIELFIEEKDWESASSYLQKVTDLIPEDVRVYMLGLFIEYKVSNDEELIKLCAKNKSTLENNKYFKYIIRFGNEDIVNKFNNVNKEIKGLIDLLEKEELEKEYVNLINISKSCTTISKLNITLEKLKNFQHFKEEATIEYENLKQKIDKLKQEKKIKCIKLIVLIVIICASITIICFMNRYKKINSYIYNLGTIL